MFDSKELKSHSKKVLTAINKSVKALEKPELLSKALRKLGSHHAGLGVTREHYVAMNQAILVTVQGFLGH